MLLPALERFRTLAAIGSLLMVCVWPCVAAPSGAILTTSCDSSGLVPTWDCPQLPPQVGQLVSIEANFYGIAIFDVHATAPKAGQAIYHLDAVHSIDFGGGAFFYPVSGSGTILVGPIDSPSNPQITVSGSASQVRAEAALLARFTGTAKVHLVSIADPGKVTIEGASISQLSLHSARTSISLTYRYLPRATKLPPSVPLPKQHLPLPGWPKAASGA